MDFKVKHEKDMSKNEKLKMSHKIILNVLYWNVMESTNDMLQEVKRTIFNQWN